MFHQTASSGMWRIPDEAVWWNVELIIVSVCLYIMYLSQSGLFFFLYFILFYFIFLHFMSCFCFGLSSFVVSLQCMYVFRFIYATLAKKSVTAEKFMRLIYSLIMWYRAISSFGLISTRHGASDSVRRELSLQIEVDVAWSHCGSISWVTRL